MAGVAVLGQRYEPVLNGIISILAAERLRPLPQLGQARREPVTKDVMVSTAVPLAQWGSVMARPHQDDGAVRRIPPDRC